MEGWNDPPKIGSPTGKLKINLNKRVAFPLSKTDAVSTNSNAANADSQGIQLPPPVSNLPISNVTQDEVPICAESNTEVDLKLEKERVMNILYSSLEKLNSNVQSSALLKLKDLEIQWDSLDSDLLSLIVELAESIENRNLKEAGGLQRKIVMKGCNSQWLHAVRQIILNLESLETSPELKL